MSAPELDAGRAAVIASLYFQQAGPYASSVAISVKSLCRPAVSPAGWPARSLRGPELPR